MPVIHSDAEFHAYIGMAVGKAIDEVMEKIFQELRKEIQVDIYDAYSPQDYGRTNALLDAWEKQSRGMAASLEFRPEWLPLNQGAWQHGSLVGGGTDICDQIFDILESGYGAYNYHKGKPIPARPMWDKFLQKVDAKFDKWMRSALRHQGLVVM